MHACTAVIEHCPDTRLYVGYVPGFAGAHKWPDVPVSKPREAMAILNTPGFAEVRQRASIA